MCGLDIMLALHELHKSHSSRSQHQQNGAKHCKILFPGQTAVFLKDQLVFFASLFGCKPDVDFNFYLILGRVV